MMIPHITIYNNDDPKNKTYCMTDRFGLYIGKDGSRYSSLCECCIYNKKEIMENLYDEIDITPVEEKEYIVILRDNIPIHILEYNYNNCNLAVHCQFSSNRYSCEVKKLSEDDYKKFLKNINSISLSEFKLDYISKYDTLDKNKYVEKENSYNESFKHDKINLNKNLFEDLRKKYNEEVE